MGKRNRGWVQGTGDEEKEQGMSTRNRGWGKGTGDDYKEQGMGKRNRGWGMGISRQEIWGQCDEEDMERCVWRNRGQENGKILEAAKRQREWKTDGKRENWERKMNREKRRTEKAWGTKIEKPYRERKTDTGRNMDKEKKHMDQKDRWRMEDGKRKKEWIAK
jgi:hypothetical protein